PSRPAASARPPPGSPGPPGSPSTADTSSRSSSAGSSWSRRRPSRLSSPVAGWSGYSRHDRRAEKDRSWGSLRENSRSAMEGGGERLHAFNRDAVALFHRKRIVGRRDDEDRALVVRLEQHVARDIDRFGIKLDPVDELARQRRLVRVDAGRVP